MKRKKNIFLIIIISIILFFIAINFVFYLLSFTKLYYIDINSKPKIEIRNINRLNKDYETEVIKEYFNGPYSYDKRLPLMNQLNILNLYSFKKRDNTKSIIINFDTNFSSLIKYNNDELFLVLNNLVKTIKINKLKIKEIYILINNDLTNAYIGRYNIYYPLIVY